MADAKITELLELDTAAPNDLLAIVDIDEAPSTTKKIQVSSLVPERAFIASVLNTDQPTGAINGIWTTLSFNSDYAGRPLTYMDRPTATRFRALIAGYYRVHYEMYGVPDANDKMAELRIIKNGIATSLTGAYMKLSEGRSTIDNGGFAGKFYTVLLAVNDYIELQAAPLAASIVTFQSFSTLTFDFLVKT